MRSGWAMAIGSSRRRMWARTAAVTAMAWLVASGFAGASAAAELEGGFDEGIWMSIGVLSGPSRPAGALADYQWDVSPRLAWGGQALVGRGRWAAGARMWRTATTQTIDLQSTALQPAVRLTSLELVGRASVGSLWGNQIFATASVGRAALGYDPDRVSFDAGAGVPVTVELKSVDEWIAGAGFAVRRTLMQQLSLGVEVDTRIYGLDTSHRNGSIIEVGRDTFGDWNARVELAWLHRRR